MLIDSHAYLSMPQFDTDRREAGGQSMFAVGTDVASGRQAVALAHDYPSIHAVVGLHPHNAKDMDGESLRQMREIAQDSRVKACGGISGVAFEPVGRITARSATELFGIEAKGGQ